jgi:cell division protein FtsL
MNRVYIQSNRLPKQEPIKERDPVQFRSLMLIFVSCSLIVLGIISYIWRGVEIISMSYKMKDIYTQQRVLKEQQQKLILEREALRSLNRIEDSASQLNLVKPNADQIVILSDHTKNDSKSVQPQK